MVAEGDWLPEAIPAAQQSAPQHEGAKVGLPIIGFKEAGFHSTGRRL